MKRKNKNPRKESERFQGIPELAKPNEAANNQIDVSQQIADIAWDIDFAQQTPEKIKQQVEQVLITLKKTEENEN